MNNQRPKRSTKRKGVVAVIVREARLLVIQRSSLVRAPLQWCFPGGGVEEGESEEQALTRELLEELNLPIQPLKHLWRSVSPWDFELSWWQVEMTGEVFPVPNPAEVAGLRWLTIPEFLSLENVLISNREFLEHWKSGRFVLHGIED